MKSIMDGLKENDGFVINNVHLDDFYEIWWTERGEYWLESKSGEGMTVTRMKMFEVIDKLFREEF